jgi:hypothetical protein
MAAITSDAQCTPSQTRLIATSTTIVHTAIALAHHRARRLV